MLDACLLMDGGWPYVAGGPGAWVHEHIHGLSTVRMGAVHLGRGRDAPREARYPAPDNLEQLVEAFPFAPREARRPPLAARVRAEWRRLLRSATPERDGGFTAIESFLERALLGRFEGSREALLAAAGVGPTGLAEEDLLDSREAFGLFVRLYESRAPGRPFAPLFRSARAELAPLLRALRVPVPRARVYHALSASGPAALVGALAATLTGAPLVITVLSDPSEERVLEGRDPAVREAVRAIIRRTAFEAAAEVIALSEASRLSEVRRGAPPERTRVIPEGIDVGRFAGLRGRGRPTSEKASVSVALVAPLVPSKDVKTFLRVAKALIERLDLVEPRVLGDATLDPAYARDCSLQAAMLGIDRLVRFGAPPDTRTLLSDLDCLVVTSAEEGEPLVVVEAMAAGVPVVATDAGAVRELLIGRTPEDASIGPAGLVCQVGDATAIASAVVRVLTDHALRERLVTAGMARAERFYRRATLQAAYFDLYERLGGRRGLERSIDELTPTPPTSREEVTA